MKLFNYVFFYEFSFDLFFDFIKYEMVTKYYCEMYELFYTTYARNNSCTIYLLGQKYDFLT